MENRAVAILRGNNREEISVALSPMKRGPAERVRINLREPHEVVFWSRRLGCRSAELWEAVDTVGDDAEHVRTFIARRRPGD